MGVILVGITIQDLSDLNLVGPNTYEVHLKFFGQDGNPLVNQYFQSEYTGTVNTTSNSFIVQVPASNGPYSFQNVTVKAYGSQQCCLGQGVYNINAPSAGALRYEPVIHHYGLEGLLVPNIVDAGSAESRNWRISDLSTAPLQNGYEWWYFLDHFLVKTSQPLNNYIYQSNRALLILKMGVLIGTDTLFRWSNPGEQNYIPGFSNQNQGQSMELGSSGATVQIAFKIK